jgi:hypothetical protein
LAFVAVAVLLLLQVGHAAERRLRQDASDRAFKAAADRVTASIRANNWPALRRDCARNLTIAHYCTVFAYIDGNPQTWLPVVGTTLFPKSDIVSKLHRYVVVQDAIDTSRPFDAAATAVLAKFASVVRRGYHQSSGLNDHAGELPEVIGPSVNGPMASNVDWRIELEFRTGRWVVTRLLVVERGM